VLRSLKKGQGSVYLEYEQTGDTIGAKNFAVQVVEGVVILSFVLRPVDSNQREDEARLHELRLSSIQIDDEYVISGLRKFLQSHGEATAMRLDILSRGTKFSFAVTPVRSSDHLLALSVRHN